MLCISMTGDSDIDIDNCASSFYSHPRGISTKLPSRYTTAPITMSYAYVRNYWTLVNSYRIETTTTSCTFDAQVLCDPTVQPLQSLLDEDPYVRMIMVTLLASVSPDSSMEILENLFTEPENTRHLSPPTYEQEDAAIGAMLEEMIRWCSFGFLALVVRSTV